MNDGLMEISYSLFLGIIPIAAGEGVQAPAAM
jgi:hypothetical protein